MTKSEQAFVDDLVNFKEAAQRLGTTHQTIRNAVKDGRIPKEACVFLPCVSHSVIQWSKIKDLQILIYEKHKPVTA